MTAKAYSIEELDRNFAVPDAIDKKGLKFYDAKHAPFCVHGIYGYREGDAFRRLPGEVAETVNHSVIRLAPYTSGVRIRFSTDSRVIAIHAKYSEISPMPLMATSGTCGFDLYAENPETGDEVYITAFVPPYELTLDGFERSWELKSAKLRYFTLNLPSYAAVKDLFIGVEENAFVGAGLPYRKGDPIVYYGSSITMGAASTRPGNIYQNIVCRQNRFDYLNFGFSGSARGEESIARYMASLPMRLFVSDYDHNAPDTEHLANTHERLYRIIREKHPTVPYLMITRCDFDEKHFEENVERRNIIYQTFRHAWEEGDRNVYFMDGQGVYRGRYKEVCTVDGTHPTDMGFALFADAVGGEIHRILTEDLH